MATKKMYKKGGTTSKKMGGKKQMGGVQSPRPAASFIEPPTAQPFAGDPSAPGNPSEFVAKKGGIKKKRLGGRSQQMKDLREAQREARKKARQERRTDRQADKAAVKALKTTSRTKRRDKINDAGEDIRMTRADRRADRRATNKASRTFRKQERKARRTSRKELRQGQRGARQEQRGQDKIARQEAVNKKLAILNQSESSSVKTKSVTVKKDDKKVVDTKKNNNTKKTTNTDVKNPTNKSKSSKSYKEAYKTRGKTYKDMTESEYIAEAKRQNKVFKETGKWDVKKSYKKKEKKEKVNPNEIKGKNKGTIQGNVNVDNQGNIITKKKDPKKPFQFQGGKMKRGGYKRRGGRR